MGCFSYICQECDEPINSDSFDGDKVELFLLKGGKVLQHMSGRYDSYGRVFEAPDGWTAMDWFKIVDMHFDESNDSGIAAIHSIHWDGRSPTKISDDDPDQGWSSTRFI